MLCTCQKNKENIFYYCNIDLLKHGFYAWVIIILVKVSIADSYG